jgi:hypothetical protein
MDQMVLVPTVLVMAAILARPLALLKAISLVIRVHFQQLPIQIHLTNLATQTVVVTFK